MGWFTIFLRIESIDDLPLINRTLRMSVRRHHQILSHQRDRGGVAELHSHRVASINSGSNIAASLQPISIVGISSMGFEHSF